MKYTCSQCGEEDFENFPDCKCEREYRKLKREQEFYNLIPKCKQYYCQKGVYMGFCIKHV